MMVRNIKTTLRQIMAAAYYSLNHPSARLKGKVVLLMYHRVLTERELGRYYVQPGMYVHRDVFEQQICYLKQNFRVLPFSGLMDMYDGRSYDGDQSYCVITFDDGWLDNYIHAYPILAKYETPATIFLPTSYIGTDQWFWPDKLGYVLRKGLASPEESALYKKWPWIKRSKVMDDNINSIIEYAKSLTDEALDDMINEAAARLHLKFPGERLLMNWEEIREMSKNNIAFGSHSSNHAILTKLPPEKMRMEIAGSLDVLGKMDVNHIPVFCYPNGSYTQEIAGQVRSCGYRAAVTTRPGAEEFLPQQLFELKRIGIHNDISKTIPLFNFHISRQSGLLP
ncbi:MAG TPA: polysaccharide deacetylase family protein [Dissulfurispiraceae bacterium]|nr:polysaccharide deacetylase family protein [Dissulfurispiraceae bacterium]